MEVLSKLIHADGMVVSKELLIAEIWENYGNAEDGMQQAISKLRKIFQDNAREPKVIQTIPKKGYRLLSQVEKLSTKKVSTMENGEHREAIGAFTGFIDRLTDWKFLTAFLVFSAVVLAALGIIYQIIFWWNAG